MAHGEIFCSVLGLGWQSRIRRLYASTLSRPYTKPPAIDFKEEGRQASALLLARKNNEI